MLIMIDGVDGTGKSTVVNTMAGHLEKAGKKVYHLKQFWSEHKTHPTVADLTDYDVIISAEPTSVWVGSAIREELIRNGAPYSGRVVADAFSLDREILYTRLLIPLLNAGKTIIQDRGVSTSLCFQPIQDPTLSRADIAALHGNALTLDHRPDHLIITDASTATVIERIGGRLDKNDDAKFEKQDFIEQAKAAFLSSDYQALFTEKGTAVHILNTDTSLDIMKQNAIALLQQLLH